MWSSLLVRFEIQRSFYPFGLIFGSSFHSSWVCLYRWLQHQSTCPVCKASVAKENVIPVYGRCGDNVDPRTRTDIPSRPLGQRPDPLERQPMNFTFAYPNRDRNGGGFFTSLYELPSVRQYMLVK